MIASFQGQCVLRLEQEFSARSTRRQDQVATLAIAITGALLLAASSIGLRRVRRQYSLLGTPVTQNFDTLAVTGTANAWADDHYTSGLVFTI